MDYKYIEQLLERYWAAETTLEEEGILRAFFSQKEIPAELEQYRDLFVYETKEMEERHLGDEFDERILAMIKEESQTTVKAREISLKQRLMPLFKAAAVVAIILTIGGAMQRPWDASWNDPRADYANSYSLEVDSADVTPMQAENVTETPADTARALPTSMSKD
ncbi:MAG: pyruvate ferredoxin oxidoreductase [Prevotella sp.]|nr:pyruvate ferredoxin oxidoreductase [Prevotella sp.]